jgi:hypothetical protein
VRFGMSLLMVKCLRWQGLVDDHAIVGNTFMALIPFLPEEVRLSAVSTGREGSA